MRQLGVKFMLRSTQFLTVILPDQEAIGYVKDWLSGQLRLKGKDVIGGVSPDGAWSIRVEEIAAAHTFDPSELLKEQLQRQQQLNPFSLGQNKSGIS